jgi:hypothetical protein
LVLERESLTRLETMRITDIEVFKQMTFPDGTLLVLANNGKVLPPEVASEDEKLYFCNHNLFRFAADGDLIWQVRRDEQGRYDYEDNHRIAVEAGKPDEPRNPFMWIDPDELGVREVKFTGAMVPGLKVRVGSLVALMPYRSTYQMEYELDIETGVAVNVSPLGPRRSW